MSFECDYEHDIKWSLFKLKELLEFVFGNKACYPSYSHVIERRAIVAYWKSKEAE